MENVVTFVSEIPFSTIALSNFSISPAILSTPPIAITAFATLVPLSAILSIVLLNSVSSEVFSSKTSATELFTFSLILCVTVSIALERAEILDSLEFFTIETNFLVAGKAIFRANLIGSWDILVSFVSSVANFSIDEVRTSLNVLFSSIRLAISLTIDWVTLENISVLFLS